jgi:rubrerythrin
MKPHWTLKDIAWSRFDATKVDPGTVKAVKAASMVEFNATDYVAYLLKVFPGDPEMMASIERWGREEVQHGEALAAWAKLADPSFDFESSFARFREGYRPPHFQSGLAARGGRAGEMIARCVVESGTSSYYSAIRDATEEPVLKQIAANIAADEYSHYRLFYEGFLKYKPIEQPNLLERLRVALTRVLEAEDDELAFAYYCANVPAIPGATPAYDRARFSREYNRRILRFYRPHHIHKAVAMIAKAAGLNPQGTVVRCAGSLFWWAIQARGRLSAAA